MFFVVKNGDIEILVIIYFAVGTYTMLICKALSSY